MCVVHLQSDVMHLADDVTKLKLFMDVLDGTKAAVSSHNTADLCESGSFSSTFKLLFLSSSADHAHFCSVSAPGVRDGHPSTCPPQAVEKVSQPFIYKYVFFFHGAVRSCLTLSH